MDEEPLGNLRLLVGEPSQAFRGTSLAVDTCRQLDRRKGQQGLARTREKGSKMQNKRNYKGKQDAI